MELSVGVFGDKDVFNRLGKSGTVNDIALRNFHDNENTITYVSVASEKIQPLLQAINMVNVPVLVLNEINTVNAEIMVALDSFNFEKGFIVCADRIAVEKLIKNTTLEKFEFINEEEIQQKVLSLKIERQNNDLLIPIDNHFEVKSIGTVILGLVKSGTVKQYDKIKIQPIEKEVNVKSIQCQDKDVKEAGAGKRVGLALKGIDSEELRRGYVISNSIQNGKSFTINFKKSKYSKVILEKEKTVFLNIGLQVYIATIKDVDVDKLVLESDQLFAYNKNDKCIIATTEQVMPRIIGSGIIN